MFVAACLVLGCSTGDQDEFSIGTAQQALTADQERVLGFETPQADYSSPTGTLGSSSIVSQGEHALSVIPNGWTEINSVPLSTLGPVRDMVSYDVKVPDGVSWGETRLILISPTLQLWWQDLGSQSLSGMTPGSYQTVTFSLPSQVQTALASTYADLRLKIAINAPTVSQPYLIDNLVILEEAEPPAPSTMGLCDFSLYSKEKSDLRDRVIADGTVGSAGEVALGTPSTVVNGNVESAGTVFLGNGATVNGDVTAAGAISFSDPNNYIVTGTLSAETPVETPRIFEKGVTWGNKTVNLFSGQSLTLLPGNYDEVHAYAGSTLTLNAGTYNMRRFFMESSTVHLIVDSSDKNGCGSIPST